MSTYIPGSRVLACKVGDDVVLLDTVSGSYFRLDSVGAWIWEEATSRDDLGTLAEDLARACDAGAPDLATVRADVADLINDLVLRGLLQPSAA